MFIQKYPISFIEQRHYMNDLLKLISIFFLNLMMAVPTYAKVVELEELHFMMDPSHLLKGDIYYTFKLLKPRMLEQKYPAVMELDSIGLLHEEDVLIPLSKFVYVVNKPVGFFDQNHIHDDLFINHIMGEQSVKKQAPNKYKVKVPGERSHTYTMRSYFDSDDISTLPNSRVIQAVTSAKKLDVLSQGASSIVFQEFVEFSRYAEGGTRVTSYIPLKENRTLIISYALTAVRTPFAKEAQLKKNLIQEVSAVKTLIESYKN